MRGQLPGELRRRFPIRACPGGSLVWKLQDAHPFPTKPPGRKSPCRGPVRRLNYGRTADRRDSCFEDRRFILPGTRHQHPSAGKQRRRTPFTLPSPHWPTMGQRDSAFLVYFRYSLLTLAATTETDQTQQRRQSCMSLFIPSESGPTPRTQPPSSSAISDCACDCGKRSSSHPGPEV